MGRMTGCKICGIEVADAIAGDNPLLCKWCETMYEHGVEYEEGYGILVEIR